MGGEIWAESIKGKGTSISFKLPIYEGNLCEAVEEPKKHSTEIEISEELGAIPDKMYGSQKKKIVFAAAKPEQHQKLIELLTTYGFTVIVCKHGDNAYETVLDEFADMVIIDLNMPNQSGSELCKKIRSRYSFTELPIIILTSIRNIDNILDTLDMGVNEIIQKPVNEYELQSKVKLLFAMKKSVERSIHNELSYYQAQITPHFLYNTLNTIIGLSYQNPDKAREALEHLAVYFRSKLDYTKHHSLVSLEEEMELVESYLAIEKIRFGDKIAIELDIDENINILLPSMTIQPLVENAIQHGLSKKSGVGQIKVSIHQEGSQVKIMIEDNGKGMSKEKQSQLYLGYNHRIGFINPYTKIKLIRNATFELYSKEEQGTKIMITLPYEKNEKI